MAFEFLLLALIDGQEPITVKRYDALNSCQDDAGQVTEYVHNNYTELRNADDVQKIVILGLLAEFNEKWEMMKLPVPSIEDTDGASNLWAKKLFRDAVDAAGKATEYGSIDLQVDALNLQVEAQRYIENSERPTTAKAEQLDFTMDPSGVRYICLAVPD